MKRKISVFLLSLFGFAGMWAQGGWDVAPCLELCQIVTGQLEPANVLTSNRGYELVNNYSSGPGFATFYAKNVVVNPYTSETVRLLKAGVSHTVMCWQSAGDPSSVLVSFYSPANAQKFRAQMQDLGFKQTGQKEKGYDVWGIEGLRILDGKDKQGKYNVYFFFIKDENQP